jgi:hypothetical protein
MLLSCPLQVVITRLRWIGENEENDSVFRCMNQEVEDYKVQVVRGWHFHCVPQRFNSVETLRSSVLSMEVPERRSKL